MTDGHDGGRDEAALLVGTWKLQSWHSVGERADITQPMGHNPEGLLIYTADGTMMTVISRAGRTPFATKDLMGGTPEEMAAAMSSFVAYGGTYELEGHLIRHHVKVSLFPNWVGTTQTRAMLIDPTGDELTLTAEPMVVGKSLRAQRLRFERVKGAAK